MSVPKILTLSSFFMEQIETWISDFLLELTIGWLLSAFDIKLLVWNNLKILSVFLWSLKMTE